MIQSTPFMKSVATEKWFFFALFSLTVLLVAFIFRPFLAVLVVGASFAVVLYPVFLWLRARKLPAGIAASLVVVLFAIALGIPLIGIGTLVFHQSQDVYRELVAGKGAGAFFDTLNGSLQKILPEGFSFDLRERASSSVSLIASNLANVFASTVSLLLAVLLVFISLFYFLKDGGRWVRDIIRFSPLADRDDEKILSKLAQAINGVVKGYLLIALIQGVLMGVGLAIFGVPNPALWGLVAMIASLLPTIGTAFVSVPAVIFLFSTGNTWPAIGLALWSVLLVGAVDNFLSPFVVGNRINIPPLFILFAVLGGIALFGPVGLLIGPLAMSLLYTLMTIYQNDVSVASK